MLFQRTKPLDLILETASKRSLTRQLGAFDLTMLGIGAVIGTGIFVLTAVAANKAGPGMMYSFIIAGIVCALTALIYSEIAAMVPVSGSAYTYSYAVLGELIALYARHGAQCVFNGERARCAMHALDHQVRLPRATGLPGLLHTARCAGAGPTKGRPLLRVVQQRLGTRLGRDGHGTA